MEFILWPLLFYAAVVLMPRGVGPWVVLGVGTVIVGMMFWQMVVNYPPSNDPQAGVGQGMAAVLVLMCGGGLAGGALVQGARAAMPRDVRGWAVFYWMLAAVGWVVIFLPFVILE
ncbi:hypothetical protein [Algicella marina]|uniref:Uncharacterized protein n=1 Tax=Algicella marina TaxID=2683284 RepID=A0A6P1T308_9RHOB|nr:hypothetical protein [Algicella marina]QHQ36131.1 hypothetical protein GO499_13615 [Algicella marina]